MSGVNGFTYSGHNWVVPMRRLYEANWFQPVARIGNAGSDELPLQAVNAMPARQAAAARGRRREESTADTRGRHQGFADLTASCAATGANSGITTRYRRTPLPPRARSGASRGLRIRWSPISLRRRSGELFLYVNDAIQVFPFQGPFERYYNNNSGTAKVELQRLPLPPVEPKEPAPGAK